jgi:hypothetical protein
MFIPGVPVHPGFVDVRKQWWESVCSPIFILPNLAHLCFAI